MKKKSVMKNFRITEEENQKFHQLAEEHQMKESVYFRFLISQKPNYIGHNINQIVKSIHSGYLGINDEKVLIAYMKKLNEEVKKAAEIIGNQ